MNILQNPWFRTAVHFWDCMLWRNRRRMPFDMEKHVTQSQSPCVWPLTSASSPLDMATEHSSSSAVIPRPWISKRRLMALGPRSRVRCFGMVPRPKGWKKTLLSTSILFQILHRLYVCIYVILFLYIYIYIIYNLNVTAISKWNSHPNRSEE